MTPRHLPYWRTGPLPTPGPLRKSGPPPDSNLLALKAPPPPSLRLVSLPGRTWSLKLPPLTALNQAGDRSWRRGVWLLQPIADLDCSFGLMHPPHQKVALGTRWEPFRRFAKSSCLFREAFLEGLFMPHPPTSSTHCTLHEASDDTAFT